MTPSDFYALLHSIQSSEIEVYHQGRAEYANDTDNIFANFDRISSQLGLTREQVLLVYALKHWDGIVSYVNGHRSQREDIRGRIKDLRMYLALLWGMVDDQNTVDTSVRTSCQDPISIYDIAINADVIECCSERINGERLLRAHLERSAEAFVSTIDQTVVLARIRSIILQCPSNSSSYFDLVLEPITRQREGKS